MAYYHYSVANNSITSFEGEIKQLPDSFNHYAEKSMGEGDIYYKVSNGKLSEIIVDTDFGEKYGRKEVLEFLENLQ